MQRWLYFVKHLPNYGWEPIVLTVDPAVASYPLTDTSLQREISTDTRVIRTNSFEPLRIYGNLVGKDKIPYGGFSGDSKTSSITKAIRGNLFIPDARRGWNFYAKGEALKISKEEEIDAVVTTGPPHSTHLIGLYLKRKTGIGWIADFRDPWAEIFYNKELRRTKLASSYDEKLERSILLHADKCIAVSQGIAQLLSDKVEREYDIITNGYEYTIDHRKEGEGSDSLNIVYTGTIAESYEPDVILSTISRLSEEGIKLKLTIAGKLSNRVQQSIDKLGIRHLIEYLGYVDHSRVLDELSRADLLLLIIPRVAQSAGIIPGKLFEYLSTHLPILALSEEQGDVCRIIKETNTGKCFKRSDEKSIYDFVKEVGNGNKPEPNRDAISAYSREELTKKVASVLRKATNSGGH